MNQGIFQLTLISILFLATAEIGFTQVSRNYFVIFDNDRYSVNENSIVRDTSGVILPFKEWTELLSTGEFRLMPYTLKAGKPDEILIKPLDEEDRRRIEQEMARNSFATQTNSKFAQGELFLILILKI